MQGRNGIRENLSLPYALSARISFMRVEKVKLADFGLENEFRSLALATTNKWCQERDSFIHRYFILFPHIGSETFFHLQIFQFCKKTQSLWITKKRCFNARQEKVGSFPLNPNPIPIDLTLLFLHFLVRLVRNKLSMNLHDSRVTNGDIWVANKMHKNARWTGGTCS